MVNDDMGAQQSGTDNSLYDLVSVLYHALQGDVTNQKYIQDAHQEGDTDLVQFFQEMARQDRQRADRAKQLLNRRMGGQSASSQSSGQGYSTRIADQTSLSQMSDQTSPEQRPGV